MVFLVFPTSRGFGGVTETVGPLNDGTPVSTFVIRLIPSEPPPPRDVIFCSHRTAAGDAPQLRGAK